MTESRYPWFDLAEDESLLQGDLIEGCRVVIPVTIAPEHDKIRVEREERDLIVLTQSCDLVIGREKVTEVLLATVWRVSDLAPGEYVASTRGLEEVRRGNVPGYHMLAACDEFTWTAPGIRIVDFRALVTLPIAYLRSRLPTTAQRLRLNPPYREHLSQAFARFCMRVGLPVDIPPFQK